MQCPYCQHEETKVTDKRDSEGVTRRRRECLKCEKRFTTYEKVELDLNVLKKDGRREKFSVEKLRRGIDKALEKRPVTSEKIDELVGEVEARIYRIAKDKDIDSNKIGEIIMEKLKKVDKVAYIRFASVYREFSDLEDFKNELKELK
ncbi:transcriptional repressor NrdR [Candidatus Pacearchaeota archaeon]|nr:transcriptional repressor NrdR [Candidatus Pacearchaeota archaeon]